MQAGVRAQRQDAGVRQGRHGELAHLCLSVCEWKSAGRHLKALTRKKEIQPYLSQPAAPPCARCERCAATAPRSRSTGCPTRPCWSRAAQTACRPPSPTSRPASSRASRPCAPCASASACCRTAPSSPCCAPCTCGSGSGIG